eukprot:c26022_g1_i1 orf=194-658(+)
MLFLKTKRLKEVYHFKIFAQRNTLQTRGHAQITHEPVGLELVKVNAIVLGNCLQSLPINCLKSLCTDTHLHKALAFLPPQPFVLQIDLLELLGPMVGKGHLVSIVPSFTSHVTYPACKGANDKRPDCHRNSLSARELEGESRRDEEGVAKGERR